MAMFHCRCNEELEIPVEYGTRTDMDLPLKKCAPTYIHIFAFPPEEFGP